MTVPAFSPDELKIVGRVSSFLSGYSAPIFNYPIAPREAVMAFYARKPVWQITAGMGAEIVNFTPRVNPDNIARAFVFDGTTVRGESNLTGGTDMFGIEWEYVPTAGGSMVRPGKPFISDANELEEKVRWPDIDSWDWEGSAKANEAYFSKPVFYSATFLNGWFERLISFMDFQGAVVAMIDEDQKEAVKAFFDKLSDLYIRILDKYITYFPKLDGFSLHDDWGGQKDTFFSPATAAEMLVPYMRRVTDFLHSKGKCVELHSCGNNIKQVPNMIAAGFDSWSPQSLNDTQKIYELYGDKLLITVAPEPFDAENAGEEEQRAQARAYAERFCRPDKPSAFSLFAAVSSGVATDAYMEELYKQSRIRYGM